MSTRLDDLVFSAAERRRRSIALVTLALWSVAIAASLWAELVNQSIENQIVVAVLIVLAIFSYLPSGVGMWRKAKNRERLGGFLQTDRYLTELKNVPTRDRFLEEVAKELAAAQSSGEPCTLVVTGYHSFDAIRSSHGDRIAHRAVEELSSWLARASRGSDPIGYIGQGVFATLLLDCAGEHSRQFMRRIPHEIEVADPLGRTYEFTADSRAAEHEGGSLDAAAFLARAQEGAITLEDAAGAGWAA